MPACGMDGGIRTHDGASMLTLPVPKEDTRTFRRFREAKSYKTTVHLSACSPTARYFRLGVTATAVMASDSGDAWTNRCTLVSVLYKATLCPTGYSTVLSDSQCRPPAASEATPKKCLHTALETENSTSRTRAASHTHLLCARQLCYAY